jgi:hypothetical protein
LLSGAKENNKDQSERSERQAFICSRTQLKITTPHRGGVITLPRNTGSGAVEKIHYFHFLKNVPGFSKGLSF